MDKIYVPNLENYKCVTLFGNGNVLRAYKQDLLVNSYVDYDDIFIDNYYSISGTQFLSSNVNCIDSQYLTNDVFYRRDIDRILIIFIVLAIVIVLPAFHLFKKIWRWL